MKNKELIQIINDNLIYNSKALLKFRDLYFLKSYDGTNEFRCEDSYISILFFLSNGEILINNQNTKVFSGNMIIIKNSKNVTVKNYTAESLCYNLNLGKDLFDNMVLAHLTDCPIFYDLIRLDSDSMDYLYFDTSTNDIIYNYVYILLMEASVSSNDYAKLLKNSLLLFITNLNKVHTKNLLISESTMIQHYETGKYLMYMVDNYDTVTLTSIAEHFNFHPAYFSSMFKELIYENFSEKLLQIKLEQAKRMLVSTNLSVMHIIELIGFKEKSHFYRSFKKYYNITPLEYRKLFT